MSFPVPQTSEGAQEATKKAVENAEERKAFFSFGDEGVTATVGENGRLLRISRYFPGEKTGFCVDDPQMPEPWLVKHRLNVLLRWAEDPVHSGGIGPSIDGSPTETIVNHRWPTFKGPWTNNTHSATNFKLQYIAHNGTIYQRFVFTHGGGQGNPALPPKLQVDANLLLRSLDFVDGENSFNKASPSDRFPYTSSYGKNHLVREHVHGTKAIRLFIHALNESNSAEFNKVDESEEEGFVYTVCPEPAGGEIIPKDKSTSTTFTIILAYTLQYVPVGEKTNFLPPGWKTITTTMDELLESRNEHSLTENLDPTLDFFLGRNLEYILSVCSIPISEPGEEEITYYALTCGDVESHRVTTPASFYAFQTLLLALMHFRDAAMSAQLLCETDPSRPSQTTLDYIFEMDRRISRVCSGHIKWVFHKAVISGGLHCPNYWVSGEQISEWWKNRYLPKGCLANAPFQILKACDFLELAQRYNLQFQVLLKEIKVPIESWVEGLDEINRLGCYAFPREDSGPTNSFYLTDHALIWRAIRSLETVYPHWKFKGHKSKLPYSSQIIQYNMVKRFTTENPQSNKRMIAATRSAIQTRFLLEANDTSLFPALEKGLFDVPQKGRQGMSRHCRNQLWTNTIDCQKFHEDNEDFRWCDPRKFALSIMMAHNQDPINSRSADDMRKHAMSVLMEASSINGLFPGWLREGNIPVSYEGEELRDSYWEAVFEIPYILWEYCGKGSRKVHSDHDKDNIVATERETQAILQEVKSILDASVEIRNLLKDGQSPTSKTPKARRELAMKAVQPFNNIVNEENIVELQDEWLYNEPSFFVDEANTIRLDGIAKRGQVESSFSKTGADSHDGKSEFVGFRVDVPESKLLDKDSQVSHDGDYKMDGIATEEGVGMLMGNKRVVRESKKRIWAFLSSTSSGNNACLRTFFDKEDKYEEMQGFLNRHISGVSRFTEETVAVMNTWVTEMHLSFYRLGSSINDSRKPAAYEFEEAPSIPVAGVDAERKPITRVTMSFQFEGDFFDRYWTCRLLDADHQDAKRRTTAVPNLRDFGTPFSNQMESRRRMRMLAREALQLSKPFWEEILRPLDNGYSGSMQKGLWQQRRVLELLLLDRSLKRMNKGAQEILTEAWWGLRNKQKTTTEGTQKHPTAAEEVVHDVFLIVAADITISRKRAEKIQRVLRTLTANLEENMAQISLWQNREKDRQAERPRWTFHDENRFRVIIQKLHVSNEHEILELTRLHAKISKLEESLVKKLEMIRSDLEERRGGETQLFTWVTVVFLPLGFATGLFSMSEAPSSQTLHNMIVTAVVAFVSIALLGPVVKTIITADIIRLPEVTNWTSQDWKIWIEKCTTAQKRLWQMDKNTWRALMPRKWKFKISSEWKTDVQRLKIKIRGGKTIEDSKLENRRNDLGEAEAGSSSLSWRGLMKPFKRKYEDEDGQAV